VSAGRLLRRGCVPGRRGHAPVGHSAIGREVCLSAHFPQSYVSRNFFAYRSKNLVNVSLTGHRVRVEVEQGEDGHDVGEDGVQANAVDATEAQVAAQSGVGDVVTDEDLE